MRLPSALRRIALAAIGCLASASLPAQAPGIALRDVTVVDVTRGVAIPGQTVVVAGNRIVAAGPVADVDVPGGAEAVDAAGRYLVPGLIDMHVHALWAPGVPENFLPLFAANGVTTVRDMGGKLELLRAFRGAPATPGVPAPRVVAAGAILDGPSPVHPEVSIAIATIGEAHAALDAVAAAGADFVKVYTLLPADAFAAIVAGAGERGLRVAGHVPYEVGPVAAARAGMWTIEHVTSETGGFCQPDEPAGCEAVVRAFREHGTRHVPTLVMQGQTRAADLCGDPRLRFLSPAVLESWFGTARAPGGCGAARAAETFEAPLPPEARLVHVLREAKIPVLAGTDAGAPYAFPGWSLHDELRLLVEAGLSSAEALRAASWDAARALARDDELGAIRPGYLADLVLLSGNPLTDIRNTRHIEAVILDGRYFGLQDLDAVFESVARAQTPGAQER